MAFIPDDAEDRFNELSPSAERFYIYLCKTRNHKAEKSFGTLDACAEKYGWKRATKFHAQQELIERGWIAKHRDGYLLLIGDFSPVNKLKKELKKSKNLDFETPEQSKKLDSQTQLKSKNLDQKSKNLDSPPHTPHKDSFKYIPALPEERETAQRASRLSTDFALSDEMIEWAKARAPGVSVSLETEKFKNYWQAKAGRDATKLDWLATWRNWILKANEWQGATNGKTVLTNSSGQPRTGFLSDAIKR